MVRGPAALLGLGLAAQAYFLVAGDLPQIGSEDAALIVACGIGVVLLTLMVTAMGPAVRMPLAIVAVALGAGLLMGAFVAADAGAWATPVEALLWGSVGLLFAAAVRSPALAIALPVFVALVDVAGITGGSAADLVERTATTGDALTLELPDWGTGFAAGRLGAAELVFLGVFAGYANAYGLRPRATAAGMAAGLLTAVVLQVALSLDAPPVPLMAAGYFLPNLDRIGALLRRVDEG